MLSVFADQSQTRSMLLSYNCWHVQGDAEYADVKNGTVQEALQAVIFKTKPVPRQNKSGPHSARAYACVFGANVNLRNLLVST